MKFLPLIWSGLWRKPVRTALLLVSLSVAFLLFGLLQGVDSTFNSIIARQKLDRLLTDPKFLPPMPLACLGTTRIARTVCSWSTPCRSDGSRFVTSTAHRARLSKR